MHGKNARPLNEVAVLWATPTTHEDEGGRREPDGKRGMELRDQVLWATPRASDGTKGSGESAKREGGPSLVTQAVRMWPTPTASESANRTTKSRPSEARGHGRTLAGVANSLWPTPTANDSIASGGTPIREENGRHSGTTLTDAAVRDLWPTPSAVSYGTNRGGAAGRVGKTRPSLESLAKTWPTPTANDDKATGYMSRDARDTWRPTLKGAALGEEAVLHSRRAQTGSTNGMALSPLFVERLVNLPEGWTHPLRSLFEKIDFERWGTLYFPPRPNSPFERSGESRSARRRRRRRRR